MEWPDPTAEGDTVEEARENLANAIVAIADHNRKIYSDAARPGAITEIINFYDGAIFNHLLARQLVINKWNREREEYEYYDTIPLGESISDFDLFNIVPFQSGDYLRHNHYDISPQMTEKLQKFIPALIGLDTEDHLFFLKTIAIEAA